jgi:hypothetical protein
MPLVSSNGGRILVTPGDELYVERARSVDVVTGQSLAWRVLLEGLPKEYGVDLINIAKKQCVQGISSSSRVETLSISSGAPGGRRY